MNKLDLKELLCELSECHAPSGFEERMTELLEKKLSPLCDSVELCRDGSVLARFCGENSEPVMVCTHMDEVGFMIKSHSEGGTMPLAPLGVRDVKKLAGRRVAIAGTDGSLVRGYIGVTPVHLSKGKDEPTYRDLYADVGAADKSEAEALIPLGSYGAYDTRCESLEGGFIKGKALVSRGAVAAALYAMSIIKESGMKPRCDAVFAFTCRGELTLSGVTSAVRSVCPRAIYVLGGVDCLDVPGDSSPIKLGGGAAVSALSASPADTELKGGLFTAAKEESIPAQAGVTPSEEAKRAASGSTAPTVSFDIPVRGAKCAAEVLSLADVAACGELLAAVMLKAEERSL